MYHIRSHSKPLAALVLAASAVAPAFAANAPLPDPIAATIPPSGVTVRLTQVAGGLISPVTGTFAPGDSKHLFVLDQVGRIYAIDVSRDGDRRVQPAQTLVADLSARIVKVGLFPPLNYDERGLLGLAFHPDYRHNGLAYTFTNEPVAGVADFTTLLPGEVADSQIVITEWQVGRTDGRDDGGAKLPKFDPARARVLLRIDKPQFNHNGGTVAFGRDGLLYVSVGDGGAADDQGPGHLSGGNGQRLDAALGKVLRIDPLARDAANGQYGIPKTNPFVGRSGIPEIYAYGFRNPYRMSFDSATGALYVADVGQNNVEEIDRVSAGANYGWPVKEGTFLFDDGGVGNGFVYADSPGAPAELADPIAQYDHADGTATLRVAIVGGFVYRGERVKALRGRYVFGDYSGPIGTPPSGHVFLLSGTGAGAVREIAIEGRTALGEAVLGFARDARGELYLLTNGTGTLNGTTGRVYRIDAIDRRN